MSIDRLVDLFLALITGGVAAALVSLYRARAQNRVDKSTEILTQAKVWESVLQQQQKRIEAQQREIDDLGEEVLEKNGYIQVITKVMSAKGIEIPTYRFRRHYRSIEERNAE